MNDFRTFKNQPEYEHNFWNIMRGKSDDYKAISDGETSANGTHEMPSASANKLDSMIAREGIFRSNATVIRAFGHGYKIMAKDCEDLAQFVPENAQIPIYEGMDDFTEKDVDSHKLAVFVKLNQDFVLDATFSIEDYLCKRLSRNFADAEDKAFIIGTGINEPTGILHATKGAEVGVETEELTYDNVIELYFSVKDRYRKHGIWLMNDKTALALRKIKDGEGNYIWNNADSTILVRPVIISEFMPDAEAGNKPVAFGDFSYYWVVLRKPVSMRKLVEKFSLLGQIGYLALEFLDGKLIKSDAVKVISLKNS